MSRLKSLAVLLVAPMLLRAGVDTMWVRHYTGTTASRQNVASAVAERDGNVYVCGSGEQQYPYNTDMLLACYDRDGEFRWANSLGGNTASESDLAHAMALDLAGNVLVAGNTDNAGVRGTDISYFKCDSGGSVAWSRKTMWYDDEFALDIAVSPYGGVYICGAVMDTHWDMTAFLVMRINPSNGDTLWTRRYLLDTFVLHRPGFGVRPGHVIDRHPDFFEDYSDFDNCATALAMAPDGNIVVTGFGMHGLYEREWWTMKFDPAGNRLWETTHHNTQTLYHDDDVAFDVVVDNTGTIFVAGFDYHERISTDELWNYTLVRYSPGGSMEFHRSLNIGAIDGDDYAHCVALDQAVPQNVYVTGTLDFGPEVGDQLVTHKFDRTLTYLWGTGGAVYGGYPDEVPYDLQYRDRRVYVTGTDGADLFVLCYTDSNQSPKDTLWGFRYNGPDSTSDDGTGVWAGDSGQVYFAGSSLRTGGWRSLAAGRLHEPRPDVEASRILVPTGTVLYNQVVTPRVLVTNQGNTPARFTAFLTIEGGYSDSAVRVNPLMPGDTAEPTFSSWTAQPAGTLAVRCSVALAGDVVPANDTVSGVVVVSDRDVGVTVILAPVDSIDSTATVTPACSVYNYGSATESYRVRLFIGGFHGDVAQVNGHAPGTARLVGFSQRSAWPRGTHVVRCSTELAADANRGNDRALGSVTVRVRDAALVRIEAPRGMVDSGEQVVPSVVVCSQGNVPATFPVWFRIDSTESGLPAAVGVRAGAADCPALSFADQGYEDSIWVSVMPGESVVAVFDTWTATVPGTMRTIAFTDDSADMVRANDTAQGTVVVRAPVHDVGVVGLLEPAGDVDSGDVVVPTAVFGNFGTREEVFRVWFAIDTLYADTVQLALGPDAVDTVEFTEWVATPPGEYVARCSTMLAGDGNESNNAAQRTFEVLPDVGVGEHGRPLALGLGAPRPNPSAGRVTLICAIPVRARVSAEVFAADGRLVQVLAAGEYIPGYHELVWDGRDRDGRTAGPGVYHCRLAGGGVLETRKLVKTE